MATAERAPATAPTASPLDLLGELARRLDSLEQSFQALREAHTALKQTGRAEPYDGFVGHVAHVMLKHFPHDRPDNGNGPNQRFGG